ncbi:MAG: hypothetical protein ACK5GV_08535 [Bacteroidota bacterium]|jgi:hypothetical protein
MANFIYNKAKERFLSSWLTDTFKAVLITNAYTPSVNHESLADIPAAARIGISAALAGKSTTGGVASANPASFTDLSTSTGLNIRYIAIIKQNVGDTEAQSYLIAFIDTATGITTGLPVSQPTATVEWALDAESNLASPNNKRLIFKL